MKVSVSSVCITAAVVLVSAFAQKKSSPTIHPDSLARYEAITSYCEKADPSSESQYASRLTGLIAGHADEEIQRDRDSDQYRQAMAQANQTLARTPSGTAVRACTEFLAEK